MTTLWIATSNPNKIREYQNLIYSRPLEIKTPQSLSYFGFPPENGKTFEDNARIKAKALNAVVGPAWVMGEDSGLCVEALGGLPGIHTARYAGDNAGDRENVAKLLKMMQIRAGTNRKAHFQSTLVVFSPEKEEFVYSGELHGEIAPAQRGQAGFGYDPVFIPEGHQKTLAELTPGQKNEISHRALAFRQLMTKLGI